MLTVETKLVVVAGVGVVVVVMVVVVIIVLVTVLVVMVKVVIVMVLKGIGVWTLGLQMMDKGQKWSSNVICLRQTSKDSHESIFSTLTQVALNPYF